MSFALYFSSNAFKRNIRINTMNMTATATTTNIEPRYVSLRTRKAHQDTREVILPIKNISAKGSSVVLLLWMTIFTSIIIIIMIVSSDSFTRDLFNIHSVVSTLSKRDNSTVKSKVTTRKRERETVERYSQRLCLHQQ